MSAPLKPGDRFTARYPFKRDEKHLLDGDVGDDGRVRAYRFAVKCWTPGTRPEPQYPDGVPAHVADGIGAVRYTVVSLHQPPGWPARVFFTRDWIDPDGKAFGRNRLRVTTVAAFRRLCRGYRYDDVVLADGSQQPATDAECLADWRAMEEPA